jgi:O-antigen ligase
VTRPRITLPAWWPGALAAEDGLVLGAVLLLPWAFGGVELWAYRSAALLLVGAAAIALLRRGWAGLALDRGARWLLPALLLGAWAAVQILPVPPALVRVASPRADALYRDTFPGYPGGTPEDLPGAVQARALAAAPEFEGLVEPTRDGTGFEAPVGGRWTGWRTLSLLPSAGLERLLWYLALLLGFLVVRERCADRERLQLYRNAMFGLFLALAVFGLIYAATSNDKLYWVRETLGQARPFGPYVNPTNFAGVMELATPWMLGFVLLSARLARGRRLADLRLPVVGAAVVLCLLAALATASKSSGLLIGLSILALLLFWLRGLRARLFALGGAAVAVALALPLLVHTQLGSRFRDFLATTAEGYGEVGRLVGWQAAVGMFRDFPLTGIGFGAFRDVFPRYLPAGETARWLQLHNDYFEVLLEGGVIGALLLLWLICGFVSRVSRRPAWSLGRRIDPEAVGLLLGLAALAVHALFDFNHQIPANALLFTTMAALAVARGEAREGQAIERGAES